MGPMRRHGVMYWMDSMQELNSRRRSGVFTENFVSILGLNMVLSSLTLEIFLWWAVPQRFYYLYKKSNVEYLKVIIISYYCSNYLTENLPDSFSETKF